MPNSLITHDYNSQPKPIINKKTHRPLPHPKKNRQFLSLKKTLHITNQKVSSVLRPIVDGLLPT